MKNEFYMKEYRFFDGDHTVIFNIVEANTDKNTVTLAISNQGKISLDTYDMHDENGYLYFEYGLYCEKIYLYEFEEIKEGGYE